MGLSRFSRSAEVGRVKLSIVIPAYNERHTLPALISAVGAVLPTVAKEIIIVDDGSRDGTRDWLRDNLVV